jgi:hypothetical protein
MPSDTPSTPIAPARPARVAALVAGALIALVAFALLVGGGALLWLNGRKGDDGYLSTSAHRFTAPSHAVATDDLDVDLDGADAVVRDDLFGKVRVNATSNTGNPVFVGIARSDDVARYLRDVRYARVTDVDYSPFHATYRPHRGSDAPAPPSSRHFWAASAHGSGAQRLTWRVQEGSWSVVVMNADGSAGVDAAVSAGATVPFLVPVGWSLIGGGLVLIAGAGALVYAGLRTPRARPGRPAQPAVAGAV